MLALQNICELGGCTQGYSKRKDFTKSWPLDLYLTKSINL